jgi:transcriptional regulator with XRE-family HTH domain
VKDEPISYWMSVARMGFEDDFRRLFDQSEMSRAELAKRLGAKPSYISRILNSTDGNFQIETMAKWARAVGAILQISLTKEGEEVVRVVDYQTAHKLDEEAGLHLLVVSEDNDSEDILNGRVLQFRTQRMASGAPIATEGFEDATADLVTLKSR